MNLFSSNLKALRKANHMNQTQVAKYLGVGQTTIANYEKGIRLPNQDTLKQLSILFNTTSDYLIGMEETIDEEQMMSDDEMASLKNQFLTYVLNDDEDGAISLIVSRAKTKKLAVDLIEKVIVTSMYNVGELWYSGDIDIAQEHFITALSKKILNRISSVLVPEPTKGSVKKTAICLTYYHELHTMGIEIIASYLNVLGYKTFYLGSTAPEEDLMKMIKDKGASLVAISLSREEYLPDLVKAINHMRSRFSYEDLKIIVGGQGIVKDNELLAPVDVDGFANNFKTLEALVSKF